MNLPRIDQGRDCVADRCDVVTFEEKDRTTKPSNTKMSSIGGRADSGDGFGGRDAPLVRQLEVTEAAAPLRHR